MTKQELDSLFELNKKETQKLFSSAISKLQRVIEQKILGFPLIEGGTIPRTEANLDYLQTVYTSLLQELEKSGYNDAVQFALESESEVIKNLKQIYKNTDFPIAFNAISQESFNLLQNQKLEYLTNLSTNAINAVRQAVTDSVIGAVDVAYLTSQIRNELEGKLKRYANTYLETARGKLIQDAQDWSAQQFRDEGIKIYWEYRGPEDNLTREECIWALTKLVFTDEEKAEFLSGGLFPHNEPRWNCRHNFVMITEKEYKNLLGESDAREQVMTDRANQRLNA